jgi:predicted MPP superfamily phosphohydrolase
MVVPSGPRSANSAVAASFSRRRVASVSQWAVPGVRRNDPDRPGETFRPLLALSWPSSTAMTQGRHARLWTGAQVAVSGDGVSEAVRVGPEETRGPERTGGARLGRRLLGTAVFVTALLLLFGLPEWVLFGGAARWPSAVAGSAAVVFALACVALPVLMVSGHARRRDGAARVGDTLLGVVWVLFSWSVLGLVLRLVLEAAGVAERTAARGTAVAVLVIAAVLLGWGYREAMRVPRVREVEVALPRLGAGLDGTRVVLLADTHYGPIDRERWSAGVAELVNTLDADVVCHAGDIADGTVDQRRAQAAPLGRMRARLAKVYVTGNHEYFGEAEGWLDHMAELGWEVLHNRHLVVERGGDRLVLAGVDDATAAGSGLPGHRADPEAALGGADPALPVLLVAHQPKQIGQAVAAGVDLQVSGHTHGGQMWPFRYLVRLDQPVVAGLSRHGERTQLYTSRGTGFWGPPFRVFAPSEVTLLTLRTA